MCYAVTSSSVLAGIVLLSCPALGGQAKPKPAYYSVVQINGIHGSVTCEAIESRKVPARRAELMREYREAAKTWNQEAADFRKGKANRGKGFDGPRPATATLLVVKQNMRGRAAADKLVAELEARHSVVRIKGTDGQATYEAVQSMNLNTRKAELDQEYRDALARWQEGAAAFRKENPGRIFSEPKPAKPSLIVLQKDLKDRAAAETLIARLQKKADAGTP